MLEDFLEQGTREIKSENDVMRQSLMDITEPINYLQRQADKEGAKLDGYMAIKFIEDSIFYQDIARGTLRKLNKEDI